MDRLARLREHVEAAVEVPRDLLLRRYPPFVTGGPLPPGHVPVFCFHGLEPASFGRRLAYLADNGYTTLSADEYFAVVSGRRAPPDRAVVLTFDDGRSSLRTVGWPLMRRHGFKGIVFVVPGRTVSRPGPLPPTLDDVEAGRATLDQLLRREEGRDAFLTWEEMQQLASSGLFDFQSHSLSHARVHVGPDLVGFLEPSLRSGYGPLDVPLVSHLGRDLFAPEAPLGAPLLRFAPRLGEVRRFHEDGALTRACVEHVAEQGGERFFERPDWPSALRALAGRIPVAGRLESDDERVAAVRRELVEARALLEQRLGRPALDLCYPWHVAGPTARRLAREAGYRSAYCGKVRGVPITLPGGDPLRLARVGEDYVELLPGRGRARLGDILKSKLSRRLRAARASRGVR
jgi:peptidoglycan/xylan/chitin deacetylase (PgdA/CDA1 family)